MIARGNARAVRGNVTVTGDRLTAFYRPKNGAEPQPAQTGVNSDADIGGNEIYRVQAEGHVHIFTATDQAQGDRAVYDIDQSVLVMTGRDLKLTTPNDVLTARDSHGILVAEAHGGGARQCGGGHQRRSPARGRYAGRLHHRRAGAARRGDARGGEAGRRRSTRRLGQAGEGRGVRQRFGAYGHRHRDRRPRGLRARHRHCPAGRTRAHHARTEPARRPRGGGEHEDRHLASARQHRRAGAGAGHSERRNQQAAHRTASAPGQPPQTKAGPGQSGDAGAAKPTGSAQ